MACKIWEIKVFVLFEFIIKEELLKAFDNSDEENDFTKDVGEEGQLQITILNFNFR